MPIIDDQGELLWVTPAVVSLYERADSDLQVDRTGKLADSEVTVLADKAYIGIKAKLGLTGVFTPKTRRRDNDRAEAVTGSEKDFNRELTSQHDTLTDTIRA